MAILESTEQELIGRALVTLAGEKADLIMLCREGQDEDDAGFRLTWTAGSDRRTFSRDTLLGVLAAALGHEATRHCRKCGQKKPLIEFAKNKNDAEWRCRYCRVCERKRVKAYDDAKKRGHKTETQTCPGQAPKSFSPGPADQRRAAG